MVVTYTSAYILTLSHNQVDNIFTRIRDNPRHQRYGAKPSISRLVYTQRRPYSQSGFFPPRSFDQARLIVGGMIGVCCTGYAANWWAEQRAQNLHDYNPLNFIRENFIDSLENMKAGRWWVGLTSSVTHFNLLHLGINMYVLWDLGQVIIRAFGVPAFFGIWIVSSAACSAASLAWQSRLDDVSKSSTGKRWDEAGRKKQQQHEWFAPTNVAGVPLTYGGGIGASGALTGMIGAVACFAPHMKLGLIFIPGSLPAWVSLSLFSALSLYCMDSGLLPSIGHAGHMGGLAGGIVSYYGFVRPWLRRIGRF